MKRQYSLTRDETPEGEKYIQSKKQKKNVDQMFCSDTFSIILSFMEVGSCCTKRQVCKEWDLMIVDYLERSKPYIHILGSDRDLSETECFAGNLYSHTTHYKHDQKLRELPKYFRNIVIDGVSPSDVSCMMEKCKIAFENVMFLNSCPGSDIIRMLSKMKIERLSVSSIGKLAKKLTIRPLKSFVLLNTNQKTSVLDHLAGKDAMDGIVCGKTNIPNNPRIISLVGDDGLPKNDDRFNQVKQLYIDKWESVNHEKLDEISCLFPYLEELYIRSQTIQCRDLTHNIPIKKLVISHCSTSIESLFIILSKCPKLEQLCLMESCIGLFDKSRDGNGIENGNKSGVVNGRTITIPKMSSRESDYQRYKIITECLSQVKVESCKLKSIVIDSCEMKYSVLYALLNSSITEKATSLCLTNASVDTSMSGYKETELHGIVKVLLESKYLTRLTRLITDLATLVKDDRCNHSESHLLLCPQNMPRLEKLVIDMSETPSKAFGFGIMASKMEKITVKELSVCIGCDTLNHITLSNMIPSVNVISKEGTINRDYLSDDYQE